jgi:hypothetical protein
MPARVECAADTNDTQLWLFDIAADPLELCNLAASRPAVASQLLARLEQYNATAVPALDPPDDPASHPAKHGGSWSPWCPDSGCVAPKPTPTPPPPPLPAPTQRCPEAFYGACHEQAGELKTTESSTWALCCVDCAAFEGCRKFAFSPERACHLHTAEAICGNGTAPVPGQGDTINGRVRT